jgi:hypothetical protein
MYYLGLYQRVLLGTGQKVSNNFWKLVSMVMTGFVTVLAAFRKRFLGSNFKINCEITQEIQNKKLF